MLRPSYHAEQTLYSSAPACSCRNSPQELLGTFPPPIQLLNTMPFMPRGENRRSARSVDQTMWRTCGIFCAWSLLFLTDVCAQSQRRYTIYFIFFFLHWFESFLSEQGVNVGCGEAAPLNWSLFRLRNILQSWLLPPVRTCGALKWNHVLNGPQAVV